MKIGLCLILITTLVLLAGCTDSQLEDEVSILFVGNSHCFFNDMPDILKEIASSKGITTSVEYANCRDGFTLDGHWHKGQVVDILKAGDWDYVVVQDQSEYPVNEKDLFHSSVRLFDQEIKNIDARTILYIPNIRNREMNDLEQMVMDITQSGTEIAQEVGADIVPAGLAWVHSLKQRPELGLYNDDNLHSSKLGAYFTACLFFSVLFEESPEGASAQAVADIATEEEILYLQRTAWDFCQGFDGN